MISHLTGRAKAWASVEWGQRSSICSSLTDFQAALKKTFVPVMDDREKAQELSGLRQGSDSVCGYAIRFCTVGRKQVELHSSLRCVFEGARSPDSRSSRPCGPTHRFGHPLHARHPDGQQALTDQTKPEQGNHDDRKILVPTDAELAGSPPYPTGVASSPLRGRRGGPHAAG